MEVLPERKTEPPHLAPLTVIMQSLDATHLISRLYHLTQTLLLPGGAKAKQAWEADLGEPITDETWTYCCTQTRYISPNYKHKLLHYKYIHRIYYTPVFLYKIHPEIPDTCPKCTRRGADFAHLTWACNKIQTYWVEVFRAITMMVGQQMQPSPMLALLGYVKLLKKGIRRFIAIAILLAKQQISLHWGGTACPTIKGWLKDLQYCQVTSEDYATLLPLISRPRNIWQPLKDYLLTYPIVKYSG